MIPFGSLLEALDRLEDRLNARATWRLQSDGERADELQAKG